VSAGATEGVARAGAGAPELAGEGLGLVRLRELLREQGGLLATLLCEDSTAAERPTPAEIAAEGPRVEGRREEYELLIEAIYEGYLLHYRAPRVVRVPEADLGLLAGDQLYAIGLARLVRLGDTHAVAELADTISLCALAHGAGDPELAEAVWAAAARAVGWGPSDGHLRAKRLLRDGSPDAFEAMRTSAEEGPAAP
jgi:hypothetical protein